MRTKYCTLIGRAVCVSVEPIRIELERPWVEIQCQDGGTTFIWPGGLDEFARADGFANWPDMRAFWAAEHPDVTVFDGVLIRWGASFYGPTKQEITDGR